MKKSSGIIIVFFFCVSPLLYAVNHELSVALDAGFQQLQADEIVESVPGYVSPYLSYLTWKMPGLSLGISLSYQPWEFLRFNASFRYRVNMENGSLYNVDYTNAMSREITHRSDSPARFYGVSWDVSVDYPFVDKRTFVFFIRLGYFGYYHFQEAYGGRVSVL